MHSRSVVNEKPAQPLDDTQLTVAADGSNHERDAHRTSSRWSPWLGARPHDGTRSSARDR